MSEELLQKLNNGFEEFKTKNNKALEDIRELVKTSENGTKESVKNAIDTANKAVKDVQDISDRMLEAEQKLVNGIASGKVAPKSLGQLVVESDEYKHYASGKSTRCIIKIEKTLEAFNNTIISQAGSPATNSDTLLPADRIAGIIPGAFRRLRVKDLIPMGTTTKDIIEATRELTFTNNAAETKQAASKPQTDVTFELYTANVKTIAHWLKVSRQVKDDAPMLISYIETRLKYGVDLREDQQLIAGDGVGENLTGMTISPNMTGFTPETGDNALDTINRIKYVIDNADYLATGLVLNPTDWGNIERTKVGSADNRYVIGDPRSAMGPFLWGLPVVVTPSMTAGKLLIAAFDIAFQYWLRQQTIVEMSDSDDTNFQKNLITIRAEKRSALTGYRPASVRYGSLTL